MQSLQSSKPWLVLFDIDDTLVGRKTKDAGLTRWILALHDVFHIHVPLTHHTNYNGWVDWQIGLDLVGEFGIDEKIYKQKFPELKEALYQHAILQGKSGKELYQSIPDTVQLVERLLKSKDIYLGLLTGNLEKVGRWKLQNGGVSYPFPFGLFADNVTTRPDIAKGVFVKAKQFWDITFYPNQIVVIGDTIHDINCAKAIGAHSIGLTAGREGAVELLTDAGADIVVDSLMDQKVLKWLRIEKR